MTRVVRVLGLVLLVVGCVAWAWVAMLEDPVDQAVAPASGSGGLGLVELELYVIDLRLAPLLLAVAGVGLIVAPFVPGLSQGLLAMSAAAGAALLVPAVAATLSAWWAGAAVLAAVLATIATLTIRRSGPREPCGEDDALSLPARWVTATVALVLLCSAFPMEVFLDFDDAALAALPDRYLVAVPILEVLVLVSGMLALLMAARRLTWLHLVTACLVLAELAVLLASGASSAGLVVIVAVAVVATAAAVAGERGRVRHRAVALAGGLALLYPVAGYLAVFLAVGLGTLPLALNGGVIDYDGLPIFLAGPFSAGLPVLLYFGGTGALGVTAAVPGDAQSTRASAAPTAAPNTTTRNGARSSSSTTATPRPNARASSVSPWPVANT
jgi:hypothetical protein